MALHQNWAHGTAFAPAEEPSGLNEVSGIDWTDVLGLRRGWGAFWEGKPGNAHWFHVSIPTPAIIEGARVRLLRIYVLFLAGDPNVSSPGSAGANITDIHVYDGPNRIATFGTFNLSGDRRAGIQGGNTFAVQARPQISLGVGISVRASFSNVGQQLIGFSAAGADFDI
jgi:hypothetical protein